MVVDAAIEGFGVLFQGATPLYIILGTLLGLFFGALPGLGGSVALALLIPITLGMEPAQAIALLGSALGGVTFGGSVTAILLNTPGTANNAATLLDGYPMAQQGRGGEAIGASATASAQGAIFGLVLFMLLIPGMRTVVLAFGPPEIFMVAVLGLTIIATVSKGTMVSGLLAGLVGLTLSYIGTSPASVEPRFAFGQVYLWDGISLVPALIGLFAIAEMINLAISSKTVASVDDLDTSGAWRGVIEAIKRPFLVLRSSIIGFGIGVIPGVGGTVGSFVSYSVTQQTAKDASEFGHGDVRGLLSSEAANDAKDGGALMPTLALGIPGSPSTAVLMAGLILHGTFPGRQLLTEDLHIVFALIGSLFLSNLLTSTIGVVSAKWLAKVTIIDTGVLVPVILVVTLLGAFGVRNTMGDVTLALVFGAVGYLMLRFGYSRVPLIIGLILGGLVERSYNTSMQISGGTWRIFVERPLSLLFGVITVLALLSPLLQLRERRSSSRKGVRSGVTSERDRAGAEPPAST
jgi:putative tricarboxylic transport membrane protein